MNQHDNDGETPQQGTATPTTPEGGFLRQARDYAAEAEAAASRADQEQDARLSLTIHQADGVFYALRRLSMNSAAGPMVRQAAADLQDAVDSDEEGWRRIDPALRDDEPFDQSEFLAAVADLEGAARTLVALFDAVRGVPSVPAASATAGATSREVQRLRLLARDLATMYHTEDFPLEGIVALAETAADLNDSFGPYDEDGNVVPNEMPPA